MPAADGGGGGGAGFLSISRMSLGPTGEAITAALFWFLAKTRAGKSGAAARSPRTWTAAAATFATGMLDGVRGFVPDAPDGAAGG